MDAREWQQVKEVIAKVLEHPAERRAELLDRAGLGANERQRVEAYLAAYDSDPEFLEDTERDGLSSAGAANGTREPGDLVDDYRIVRKIGEGGMGEVFEAEQLSPIRRRLALKLLRPGRHDSRVLARFEAERQILASMSHRNIAQIFDAGDVEGRPYLAMELVEGAPLVEHCDRRRLSIEGRIALFVEVCRGVQHAHQRGIIHRDLKPSNILVCEQDGEPLPKVIDFGISKVTADGSSRYTEHGQWLGTPDYMSPEQASGGTAVDTRSDVYSLGVLLYELLTGRLPFDTAALRRQGLDVLLDALRKEPPVKPSRRSSEDGDSDVAAARGLRPGELTRRLRGDLDLVALKALAKDPDERYSSPLGLAQDLLLHLDHQPLVAVEPTVSHALGKLLRRHRLAVVSAAALGLSLVVGMIGTGLGLMRARAAEQQASVRAAEARAEAERANREAATAARVTNFMVDVFHASDPTNRRHEPGVTLRQVLDRGAERVRRELADEPLVQARLMDTIGKSYMSLGLFEPGRTLIEEAALTLEQSSGETPELADFLHHLADVESSLADYEAGLGHIRRSLDIRRRHLGDRHQDVARGLHSLGSILSQEGRTREALSAFEEALAIKREVHGDDHLSVALTLNSVGLRLLELEEFERGMPMIEKALAALEHRLGPDHPDLAISLNNLAKANWHLDRFEAAERLQQRALAIDEKAFGSDHPHVALSLMNLALLASKREDCEHALARTRRARAIFAKHFAQDHPHLAAATKDLRSYEKQCQGGVASSGS